LAVLQLAVGLVSFWFAELELYCVVWLVRWLVGGCWRLAARWCWWYHLKLHFLWRVGRPKAQMVAALRSVAIG